jgi:DNA repair protein RecO (recombination protein O)
MIDKLRGIVIGSIPYSETSVILKVYTDHYGLIPFMVNGVRSRKGAIKPSQIQLLALLELDISYQQNKSFQRIKELKSSPVLSHLHFDIVKSSIAMFMAEFIHKCIKAENQKDEQLFEFLFSFIQFIDIQEKGLGNIPSYFLIHFSKYLGFAPATNFNATNIYFSLREGVFVSSELVSADSVDRETSFYLNELMNLKLIDLSTLQIPKQIRVQLMDVLIRYFSIHIPQFGELNSHKILATIF